MGRTSDPGRRRTRGASAAAWVVLLAFACLSLAGCSTLDDDDPDPECRCRHGDGRYAGSRGHNQVKPTDPWPR